MSSEKLEIIFVLDRYMSLKNNLKPTTKSNYLYMYDRFIRDTFGKRNIAEIKYSDVVQFYNHLTKKQETEDQHIWKPFTRYCIQLFNWL